MLHPLQGVENTAKPMLRVVNCRAPFDSGRVAQRAEQRQREQKPPDADREEHRLGRRHLAGEAERLPHFQHHNIDGQQGPAADIAVHIAFGRNLVPRFGRSDIRKERVIECIAAGKAERGEDEQHRYIEPVSLSREHHQDAGQGSHPGKYAEERHLPLRQIGHRPQYRREHRDENHACRLGEGPVAGRLMSGQIRGGDGLVKNRQHRRQHRGRKSGIRPIVHHPAANFFRTHCVSP